MQLFLRLGDVAQRTSLSPATVRRLVAKGEFPRPIKISAGRVAWPEIVIEEWMASAIEAARGNSLKAEGA